MGNALDLELVSLTKRYGVTVAVDAILVAVGRTPNVEGLGLEDFAQLLRDKPNLWAFWQIHERKLARIILISARAERHVFFLSKKVRRAIHKLKHELRAHAT